MIRAVMLGRFGNNLFQYAIGRVLSEKHRVPLIMDGSWFNSHGWSQVECLKLLPGPASGKVKIVRRFSLGARALFKATGNHYWEYLDAPVLREDHQDHSFNPLFTQAPSSCLLFGYFQCPKYFTGMEDAIRAELSTDHLGLESNHSFLAEQILQTNSVAVHVRRTDYLGNPNLQLCGVPYYNRAIQRLRNELEEPRFFIFSDDSDWCSHHFRDLDTHVVRHDSPPETLVDFHLMRIANHHIIANSSYSWWAAWLGKKDHQRVLMPSRWFTSIHAPIHEKQCEGWDLVSVAH